MSITQAGLNKAVAMARQYGATRVLLFGSALDRPEEARDLDLAADIPGLDAFAYAGRLEELLEVPVDVIPLTPRNAFVEHIEAQGQVLYDAATA